MMTAADSDPRVGQPERLVRATLRARETDDGLCSVRDDVPIGRIYVVNLATIRSAKLYNVERRQYHDRLIIEARLDVPAGAERFAAWGWYPVELLTIRADG